VVAIDTSDLLGPEDLATRRYLVGKATIRRIGARAFPVFELVHDGAVVARLGRFGWLSVFLGRGQRVEVSDGRVWHVRSHERSGIVSLVVEDSAHRLVASGSARPGGYGINGKGWAYVLAPTGRHTLRRENRWLLRGPQEEVGYVTAHPSRIETTSPVPLPAALLSLDLVRFGIPGESNLNVPSFRWDSG
jgi:hypothetical protein